MATVGAGTRPDVTLKLSQLQNLCKRDPEGYRNEYDAQKRSIVTMSKKRKAVGKLLTCLLLGKSHEDCVKWRN